MPKTARAPTSTNTVASVEAALELLELLSTNDGARLSDLVALSGSSLNQTFRLLATLEDTGFVMRDEKKRYWLGAKLYLLGSRSTHYAGLVSAAAPEMDALSALSGESILLAVRVGLERVVIATRISRYSLRVDWAAGSRLPLHVGGVGVALLAFAPPGVRNTVLERADAGQLEGYTATSMTTRAMLEAEIAQVRASGVRVSKDDYAVGEFSVAAPILGADGVALGALTVAGFTARLDAGTQARYVDAVRGAVGRIAASVHLPQ
jgi:DNA-binding IclR family transcriptional regulator